MSDHIDVPADLMAGFLDEAPTYLSSLESGLLAFEQQAQSGTIALRGPEDHARMNEIFRAAHSLKGLAASLGFQKIRDLTHLMESLFDELRNGKRELTRNGVETLYAVVDKLRALVEELVEAPATPVGIEQELASLQTILNNRPGQAAPQASPPSVCPPVEIGKLTDDADLLGAFLASSFETLDEANAHLLKLEESGPDDSLINDLFRCAHNFKGACGAVGCSSLQTLTHQMETVLDRVRHGELALDPAIVAAVFAGLDRVRADLNLIQSGNAPLLVGDGINEIFARWTSPPVNQTPAPPAPKTPTCEADAGANTTLVLRFPKGFTDAPIQACILYNRLADLGEIVSVQPDVDKLENSSVVEELRVVLHTETSPSVIERVVRAYNVESVTVTPPAHRITAAPSAVAPGSAGAAPAQQHAGAESGSKPNANTAKTEGGAKAGETLRVDLERLDQLMNLGGELVITKARFAQIQRKFAGLFPRTNLESMLDDMAERIARLRTVVETATTDAGGEANATATQLAANFDLIRDVVGRIHKTRPTMNEFTETVNSLSRIAESMQKRIMQTRMVSIGPLFQRFRRVIRDIAKSNNKSVELVLHGEATELDKRMIDELVDPLTHMVRNSVDHGIETPEQRSKAGKPPVAHVVLNAYHRGRHICIEIGDDGRGIDVERIKRKLIERELATAAQVAQMSDHEAIQYIFRPGFSTAETVTDVSGRGMGMDIVRSKIDGVNGTIDVQSEWGKGTTITISLPLTLAIINAMLVRVGSGCYAVPIETVTEILTIPASSVKRVKKQPVVVVRDQVIPLGFFEQIFSVGCSELHTQTRSADSLTVLVLGLQSQRLGLIVDELIAQEDIVIKDLAANYRNVNGIAGASIMGDGSVALILDVGSVMTQYLTHGGNRADEPSAPRQRELCATAGVSGGAA
ncbi:MAG: Hpt domain-containing protein [Planctomycetes bacterium]|nr:Hpt domain-containing protein [Planctomycetota bacterium]